MRIPQTVLFAVIIFLMLAADAATVPAQSRHAKPSKTKKSIVKTVSLGVINGKARELVRPNYPPAAIAVRVSGSVFVDVSIDVDGRVLTAKSHRGHPLLVPTSIQAALASSFEPMTVGGNPVRIKGVIVYRYLSSSLNWLELGYSADSMETLIKYLPAGFNEERSFLESSGAHSGNMDQTIDAAWSIINGKLGSDEKSRWLIAVGRQISALSRFHWDVVKRTNLFGEIRTLLDTCPENVSRHLKSRLTELIDPENTERFDDNLISLADNLYQLGR